MLISVTKKIFDSDFPSPRFDVPKVSNFTSGGVQNHDTKNRRLGTIVTSIQDSKPCEKQISQSFSYCELINLLRNGTTVRCLWENVGEICFSRDLESWIDVTIVPSPQFLVTDWCTLFTVIPQKLKLPMNIFETFTECSLPSTVSKKHNKNDRSPWSLIKRCDRPILPK